MDVVNKLEKIFKDTLELDDQFHINDELAPGKMEEWDSLANMQLIENIENEFDVKFEFEELMKIENWKSLKCILLTKVG